MPLPAKMTLGQGALAINRSFSVSVEGYADPRIAAAVKRLLSRLKTVTGLSFAAGGGARGEDASSGGAPGVSGKALVNVPAALLIKCERAGAPVQKLGEDESYRLEITAAQAKLDAPNALGVLHGLETFLQLVTADSNGWSVPVVSIEDQPRFPWRGLLIDVSRHWMPEEVILRNLDAMAAVKLNVLHWHLSDDQGFRVESKRYPKLQARGSDGHFYTQEQVRKVIAYARDRGIRVVPEFDMPAHITSWLVGYPSLGSNRGPYQIARAWGLSEPAFDPTRQAVYTFLDGFFGEMMRLFPDEYVHIGGDEVNGREWNRSRRIRLFRKQHHLADNRALQAYFNQRLQAILKKHGKRMEGWDEILNPALPKNIVIQSWRGAQSLADAAQLGFQGILSSGYYLDAMKPAGDYYLVDPVANETAALAPEQQKLILGGEACAWAEFLTPDNIDSRIWPRTAAIAERLWSPQDARDIPSMYRRLDAMSERLELLGLRHESGYTAMLDRMALPEARQSLKVLADVVHPVSLVGRVHGHTYTQDTPLNRLADAAQPESRGAREFASLVDDALAGRCSRDDLRPLLGKWRDNGAKLRPELEQNFLLQELEPLSLDLSNMGSIGLQALDYLDAKQRPPADWVAQQQAFLAAAAQPRAELILAPVASIVKLVEAAASQ